MSEVQKEVARLLEEAIEIHSRADKTIDALLEEFQKEVPERERPKRRAMIRRKRLHIEKLQDKGWANISQCYKLIQEKGVLPSSSCTTSDSEEPIEIIQIEL